MTPAAEIILATAQLVVAVGTLVGVVLSARASQRNGKEIEKTKEAVQQVHVATNGMKDELVAATRNEAYAQGIADERARAGTIRPESD